MAFASSSRGRSGGDGQGGDTSRNTNRRGLFSGPCPVDVPRDAWSKDSNVFALISAFLQLGVEDLMLFVEYYRSGHATGAESPVAATAIYNAQRRLEIPESKRRSVLAAARLSTRTVWRELAPLLLHARDNAPTTRGSPEQRNFIANACRTDPRFSGWTPSTLPAEQVAIIIEEGHLERGREKKKKKKKKKWWWLLR